MFGVHQTRIYCAVAIERPYKSIGYSHLSPALRNQPQVPLLLAQLSQLRVILGIFAIIFVVKSCIFIAEL